MSLKKQKGFNPEEIIFAATSACNLKCSHCFVSRNPGRLSTEACLSFLDSCRNFCNSSSNAAGIQIDKIGFSGGEPFLYMDFLLALIKKSVECDFMFDRLMTNGIWWNTKDDLRAKLKLIYDAGFDGKIGLSWDSFHDPDNLNFEKYVDFIKEAHLIFGCDRVEIQSVIKADDAFDNKIKMLAERLNCSLESDTGKSADTDKTGRGIFLLQNDTVYLPVYREPQTFQCSQKEAWEAKKWFKDDYCQGPGNVLFVHSSGNIAPCCGFANEEPALFIGNINQSFEAIINQAAENKLVQICYNSGLSKLRKTKKIKKLLKEKGLGKTQDLCTFCQFVSQNLSEL